MMKPKGKCFAKNCKDCNWYRQREFEHIGANGMPDGVKEIRWCCEFQTLINAMHYHMGSLDGLQMGINEARNSSLMVREVLLNAIKRKQIENINAKG